MEPMKEVQAKIMNHIKGSEFIREKMSMSHIRTLFEMIGTGEERPFSVPPSVLFLTRINSNIDYFIVNYIIIFALILFVLLLTDLFRLFACSVLVLLWILALRKLKQSEEVLQFNIAGRVIGSRHVLIALGVVTAVLSLWILLPVVVTALLASFVISGIHAATRETRFRKQVDEAEDNV